MSFCARTAVTFACIALLMGGCSVLPAAAPTAREVTTDQVAADSGFVVVDVDPNVISVLGARARQGFGAGFSDRRAPASNRIGPGDTLQIAVWEGGAGGLFSTSTTAPGSTGARAATMQPAVVSADGMISVPYAGTIRASGETPTSLRRIIEARLADKAIQPQVEVSLATSGSNVVAVNGEVNRAGVVVLSARGDRLLDVIANAGGPKYAAAETSVTLTRHGVTRTVMLQKIVESPSDNIGMRPGDSVFLTRAARTFTAYGAAGRVGHYPFDVDQLSLAEALAKAGGLIDAVADPSAVFLFRYEPRQTVRQLLPADRHAALPNGQVPVVYRVNLREANGYFMAQSFGMRDKDIILAANSDGAQLLKFFTLVRGATGVVYDLTKTSRP